VNIARLIGANRDFILNRIPHISKLMVDDLDTMLAHFQTIVIGNRDPDFQTVPQRLREDRVLVDLVRISEKRSEDGKYDGICW
jgi:GDP-mannose 6-dehydrogenase